MDVVVFFCVGRSTVEQKNSTSLPSDNAKAQDTGQQNNQGKGSFNGPDGFCDQFTVDFHTCRVHLSYPSMMFDR